MTTRRFLDLQSTRLVDLSMPSTRHRDVSKPVCPIDRTFRDQQADAAKLDAAIAANLKERGYGG